MADFFMRHGVCLRHRDSGRNDVAQRDDATPASAHELLNWAEQAYRQAQVVDVFREKEGRSTFKVQLEQGAYFVKLHRGVGWREILKNLVSGKRPVLGAADEYRALRALQHSAVSTPGIAAYAQVGGNPARRRSVIVTDALQDTVSLEEHCAGWRNTSPSVTAPGRAESSAIEPGTSEKGVAQPSALEKTRLIRAVAQLSRQMHACGVNHRDFYLCHIHLRRSTALAAQPSLVLIDLHRAQVRNKVPQRSLIKDLAALYFSAMDAGLTRRDELRFVRHYTPGGLRAALGCTRWQQQERISGLWPRVQRRAQSMYKKVSH